ncbi:MAG TPA: aldolase/citrate lyase family protein [Casimicrobiaceae bacterium]|nr:aldolase/citrate lyase family protein [Casimicrobiaceae bacterium]
MTSTESGPTLRNPLAEKLKAGKLGLAMIIKQVQSVDIAVAARTCGYDAINVDLEHSVISESAAAQISITALNVGITPLVRIPSHDGYYANRILDAGAMGIVAPHVDTADQARAIVRACKFAPFGERSVAGNWPHLGYKAWPADSVRRVLNETTTVVVMLETPAAVERADAIAAVPGVDILHIGTTDLCDAMGMPGKYGDPAIERAFERVVDACRRHGKVAGAGGLGSATDVMQKMVRLGVRFVTAGNEWAFMLAAAKERAGMLRKLEA